MAPQRIVEALTVAVEAVAATMGAAGAHCVALVAIVTDDALIALRACPQPRCLLALALPFCAAAAAVQPGGLAHCFTALDIACGPVVVLVALADGCLPGDKTCTMAPAHSAIR